MFRCFWALRNHVFLNFGNMDLGSWHNTFLNKKHKKTNFCIFWRKSDVFPDSSELSMISLWGKVQISGLDISQSAKIEHFWTPLKRNENQPNLLTSLIFFHLDQRENQPWALAMVYNCLVNDRRCVGAAAIS